MNKLKKEHIVNDEQRTLKLSLIANGLFFVLALIFALFTQSGAILFDGIYSLISFSMAVLTLKVAKLIALPDDDIFHFGYAAIEPTLNLFKSIIIILACIYAVFGAINQLINGGNPTKYGIAAIYGFMSTIGCFLVAWVMFKRSEKFHSDLVKADAKTWLVDGVLSGAILIGFLTAWWLVNSPWPQWAQIVDPVILIALGLSALPVPVKIMLESLREVIHKAPTSDIVDKMEEQLKKSLINVGFNSIKFRVSKRGRRIYVLVHIIVNEEFSSSSIDELDDIRKYSHAMMKEIYPSIEMDLVFIKDPFFAI